MALILLIKEKIQKFAHTITFWDIVRLTARKNILRSYQTFKKKLNNKKRLIPDVLTMMAKGIILFSILRYN